MNLRSVGIMRFLFVLLLMIVSLSVAGQSEPAEQLRAGESVAGELTIDTLTRIYFFTGLSGDVVNLTATSSDSLSPALLLTDINGAKLAEAADTESSGTVTLRNVSLPLPGAYYVTVFPAPQTASSTGTFDLSLTLGEETDTVEVAATSEPATEASTSVPEATAAPTIASTPTESAVVSVGDSTPVPDETVSADTATPEATTPPAEPAVYQPPADVALSGGIEVQLSWDAPVDMNLNVRDPLGEQLYFDNRSSNIGGAFGADANGVCEIISDAPVETATWPGGFLPSGSYEILVFYREECTPDTGAVSFTVNVTANGQAFPPIEGTLTPPTAGQDSVYVASFYISPDGESAEVNFGDVYPDASLRILPDSPQNIRNAAQPINRDNLTGGSIFGERFYDVYSFEALSNERISISLEATAGSLDTLLQVMDADGGLVDVNDDFDGTNSALNDVLLVNGGTYYIVVTRYGKEIGGTEGSYQILLSGATGEVFDPVAQGLPAGDIQISLTWNTTADLQLLVRDPVGDSVFDDDPEINSGGILETNGNVDCVETTTSPVSYVYWPVGFLRPGTYEIEVWYQNTCNDTGAVEFDLSVAVDGATILAERQQPQPGQRFVKVFTINPDRSVQTQEGGYIGGNSSTIPYESEAPLPITLNTSATGQITLDNYFDVYSFEGTTGQTVTISMSARTRPLDTKLFLISPAGIEIADNDDITPGENTDSSIANFTLPLDGEYLIIATRFGMRFGGTVGSYGLTLTPGTPQTP